MKTATTLGLILSLSLANAQTSKPNPLIDCIEVSSYSEFSNAVNSASSGAVLSFCPFDITHDDASIATVTSSNVVIACDKKTGGAGTTTEWTPPVRHRHLLTEDGADEPVCKISGSAGSHLSIQANGVSVLLLDFHEATSGALKIGANVEITNLMHLGFYNNVRDSDDGAAIEIAPGASFTSIMHCEFIDNETVEGSGGAISSSASLTVYRSYFTSNHAQVSGGAIHKKIASEDITISRSEFLENTNGNGDGPAVNVLSTGAYCDAGENQACLNKDQEDAIRCDGVYSDTCDFFADACPTPAPSPPIGVPTVQEPPVFVTKSPTHKSHKEKQHTHNSSKSKNKGKYHNHTHTSHFSHKHGHSKHSGSNHTHTNHTHWSKEKHGHSKHPGSNHTHTYHTHWSKQSHGHSKHPGSNHTHSHTHASKHTHTHHSGSQHKSLHTHKSAKTLQPISPTPPSPSVPTSPVNKPAGPPNDGDLSNDYRKNRRYLRVYGASSRKVKW